MGSSSCKATMKAIHCNESGHSMRASTFLSNPVSKRQNWKGPYISWISERFLISLMYQTRGAVLGIEGCKLQPGPLCTFSPAPHLPLFTVEGCEAQLGGDTLKITQLV